MGLFSRLDEFVDEFPTGIPKQLIELVQGLLRLLQSLADEEDDHDLLASMCTVIEQIDPNQPGLSQALNWLDNAHTAQTPRGLVQLIRAASREMDVPGDYLVTSDHELNYSLLDFVGVWREMLSDLLDTDELNTAFSKIPHPCYLVRFPRLTRENVLNHTILGHELGHPIADDFIHQYEVTPVYQRRVKHVTAAIARELTIKGLSDAELRREQRKAFNTVQKLHERALEELISDAVAVYTFGPSALFAFYDLFIGGADVDSPPQPPTDYPPDRYRIRLMYRLLEEEGHIALLRRGLRSRSYLSVKASVIATIRHLKGMASKRTDIIELNRDPLRRIAYAWVRHSLPRGLAHARRKVTQFLYQAHTARVELPELLELLALGIPPAERGRWPKTQRCDWRSGLLAAWCTRLALIAKHTSDGNQLESQLNEVSSLAMKGVEYAILRTEYSIAYPRAIAP